MDDVRPVFVCCGSDALSHSLEYDLPSPVYVEVHTEKEKNDTDAARSIVSSQKMAISKYSKKGSVVIVLPSLRTKF